MPKHGEQPKIKSIDRTFLLLEELQDREGAGVTELANHFDLSKSTVHDYLRTLQRRGYVEQRDDGYHLALPFLTLGGFVRQTTPVVSDLYEVGKPELDRLANETDENARLMFEQNGTGIIIYCTSGRDAVKTDIHPGRQIPLHSTSLGKAILANLPAERRRTIIEEGDLQPQTEKTITDETILYEQLETIRKNDISFDKEERFSGIRCVGAPIFGTGDRVLGAMSVSGPRRRMKGKRFEVKLPELVRDTARIIEIRVQNR